MNGTRIVRLKASNVKRLVAVDITPRGAVVQITGRNGAGKSSVLDAIAYAIGGKALQAARPVRDGQSTAEVVVDLGEMIVRRTWKGDASSLSVESRQGMKFASPQALLDRLVGTLSFDPLAFTRLHPREQQNILAGLAGLDLDRLNAERKTLFDERTIANREAAKLASVVDQLPRGDAQAVVVDVKALADELQAANEAKAANDHKREEAEAARLRRDAIDRHVRELREELADQERRAMDAEAEAQRLDAEAAALHDPNVSAIKSRLASADAVNRAARDHAEYQAKCRELEAAKQRSQALTAKIAEVDAVKESAIEDAQMPVDGLGLCDDGITLNGLPFDQASSAEQLRVSVAMGLAANPKLRVLLIRDGSLLDDTSMRIVAEMAEKAEAQVWIERVSDGEPIGVVIEDGMVKQDLQ